MADFSKRLSYVKTIQTVRISLIIFTCSKPMRRKLTFMALTEINLNAVRKAQAAFIIQYFDGIKISQLFMWFDGERKYNLI